MIDSPHVVWEAPDSDHPARRAGQVSMATVAKGDKEGWLALFTPDGIVQDPVGPSFLDPTGEGHHGRDAIAAFWDSFVGTVAEYRFHVTDSFANGDACANIVTITTTFADGGSMRIEAILIYTIDPESGLLRSIRAHWEPDRAMATYSKA